MYRVILLLILIIFPSLSNAQSTFLIPKAGVTISSASNPSGNTWHHIKPEFYSNTDDPTSYTPSVGVLGGIALEIGLSDDNSLALQPELLFLQRGFTMTIAYPEPGSYDKINYKLNYLEIPLLLEKNFQFNRLRPFINLGPSLSFGLTGRERPMRSKKDIVFNKRKKEDKTLAQPRFNWGAQLGIGLGYSFSRTVLQLEACYGRSFRKSNVGEEPYTFSANGVPGINYYQQFWMINLGLALPLGKE